MKILNEKNIRHMIINIAIVLMLVMLSVVSYCGLTLNVFSNNKAYMPYYHGNRDNNNISFMFNVYSGTEYVESILEVLKQNNIKATFFVGGCWVNKNNIVLNKIYNQGHEIGNHGYWHKDHKKIDYNKNKYEINLNHILVKNLINYEMKLFAPPSGSFGQNTLLIAEDLGYKTIMWTKDTIDWRDKDSSLIFSRATKNPKSGDLILMHPTIDTLKALPNIISFYNERGYKLTTVSENIGF